MNGCRFTALPYTRRLLMRHQVVINKSHHCFTPVSMVLRLLTLRLFTPITLRR